jgi:glycosyltransferase involved in cell wall biosynthesis
VAAGPAAILAHAVKVLYFGTYDRRYPRNAQVISCLRRAGVEVVEHNRGVWEGRENWRLGLRQALRVARAELALARFEEGAADAVVVGYPGHLDISVARRVAAGRPLVFNPLVSLYDTLVEDRGRFRRGSLPARVLSSVDRFAFTRATLVVADTDAHAAYFSERFGLPPERLATCFVGAEDRLFRPGPSPTTPFHALFVGKLIPLHGLETILAAARMASEIPFRVVGSGQLEPALASRPPNVEWVPWIEYESLPAAYHAAGCALGIFDAGEKAARVIPNKAFQALACRRPLVTADTPAARELLTDGETALLVPPADPESLAASVRRLAEDPALAAQLGERGLAVYEERASEAVLGSAWRALLERLA